MKFKVSSKVKGSLILKSIGRPVAAGATVHVEGHALYADDIQRALKTGLLTPSNPEEQIKLQKEIINKTTEAVLINKSDRVVIIGGVSIRPNGSTIRDINELDINAVKQCIEKGLIQVIVDVDKDLFANGIKDKPSVAPKKQIELEEGIDILEENTDHTKELVDFIDDIEQKEDKEEVSKAVVWDFRAQESKEAKVVPKTGQKLLYDENDDKDDVNMIDALDNANDVNEDEDEEIKLINEKIENMKKLLAKKKSSKNKTSKKKETSSIKTKFKTEGDVAQPLDSMGNLLKNDTTHMVEGFGSDEVSFVDQEQAQKSIDEAKKRDSGINIDLD